MSPATQHWHRHGRMPLERSIVDAGRDAGSSTVQRHRKHQPVNVALNVMRSTPIEVKIVYRGPWPQMNGVGRTADAQNTRLRRRSRRTLVGNIYCERGWTLSDTYGERYAIDAGNICVDVLIVKTKGNVLPWWSLRWRIWTICHDDAHGFIFVRSFNKVSAWITSNIFLRLHQYFCQLFNLSVSYKKWHFQPTNVTYYQQTTIGPYEFYISWPPPTLPGNVHRFRCGFHAPLPFRQAPPPHCSRHAALPPRLL